ncbi:MAG: hypothetical protein IV097_06130 [Burkholderiaceae bacterium]|nr:hypothetical protein [Burkholderiaceae bacterium]
MTTRLHLSALCAALCLSVTACGGGSDDKPLPPVPRPMMLTADNMLDAVGVAALAHERAHGDASQLLGAVFNNYVELTPAGTYPCAVSGTLTLTRPDPLRWHYAAQNCDTGAVLIKSGQLQLDATQPAGQGLKLQFTDTLYRASATPAAAPQTVTGSLTVLINVADDLGKRSTGSMTFTSNGRADIYTDIFIANKTSDAGFVQYGASLKTPRFAYELKTLFDQRSLALTLEAEDGSSITATDLGSSIRLELRASPGTEPTLSKTVSQSELDAARSRALQ